MNYPEHDRSKVRRIIAATDFSVRSDRAIRRATLLAKQLGASLVLIYVVDDDQPESLVRVECAGAAKLLRQMGRTIRQVDGLVCDTQLMMGEAFHGILNAAEEGDADLVLLGPHRRRILQDVFIGTTAERVIRNGSRPVIMANGVPAAFYRNVLVAVDLSEHSMEAVRAVVRLGLNKNTSVTVIHAFDTLADSIIARSAVTEAQSSRTISDEVERATSDLIRFLNQSGLVPNRCIVLPGLPAGVIRAAAREMEADLIVIGTHGRSAVGKLLLGSVAEDVLRAAEQDVLGVPFPKVTEVIPSLQ